jgi:predicted acylesterase/phospholipase RssA
MGTLFGTTFRMTDLGGAASDGEPPRSVRETPLLLVLEGGGAKGIGHIAAWEVLARLVATPTEKVPELPPDLGDARFCLTGVAGTSAGALVAAFIAAGASASELIDAEGRVPLCSALGLNYFHEVFGLKGWRKLSRMRALKMPWSLLAREIDREVSGGRRKSPAWATVTDRAPSINWLIVVNMTIAAALFVATYHVLLSKLQSGPLFLILFLFLARVCLSVSDEFLRRYEQRRARMARGDASVSLRILFHPISAIVVAGVLAIFFTVTLASNAAFYDLYRKAIGSLPGSSLDLVFWLVLAIYSTVTIRRLFKGVVDTSAITEHLNDALRTVLAKAPRYDSTGCCYVWEPRMPRSSEHQLVLGRIQADPTREVTFRDMYQATGISISVVAADIVSNSPSVFSTTTHLDFPVAKAVAASLAIPFAFKPVRVGRSVLLDGGIVSNFPIWIQRKQLLGDPDARILAVGLGSDERDTWLPTFFELQRLIVDRWRARGLRWVGMLVVVYRMPVASLLWPLKLISNALSSMSASRRALELEAHDRLHSFSLMPRLEVLDFDLSPIIVRRHIDILRSKAKFYIETLLWRRDKAFQETCGAIEQDLRRFKAATSVESKKVGRLRMFWAQRSGNTPMLRVKFVYGFEISELDDRLVLPPRSSLAAIAGELGQSVFADAGIQDELLGSISNRYARAVRWRHFRWGWAIPSLEADTGRLIGVFMIESDTKLANWDAELGAEGRARLQEWIDPVTGRLRRDPLGRPDIRFAPRTESTLMSYLEYEWANLINHVFIPLLVEPES